VCRGARVAMTSLYHPKSAGADSTARDFDERKGRMMADTAH
jgi:hypothetical protein